MTGLRTLRLLLAAATAGGVVLVPASTAGAAAGPPSAWYQLGAYGGHSGSNDYETTVTAATASSLHAAWRRAGTVTAPLVHGGKVWTVGADGVLRSSAVGTGAPLTATPVGRCTKGAAPPVLTATLVVVPTRGCGQPDSVRAFRTSDGAHLWQRDLAGGVWSATTRDGALFLTGPSSVSALDITSGQVRWTKTGDQAGGVESAASGGLLYVAAFNEVQARRVDDGRLVWRRDTGESYGWLAAVGDRVYVSNVAGAGAAGHHTVTCLSSTGAYLWDAFLGEDVEYSDYRPAVSGGRVFVSAVTGEQVALDAATGAELWRKGSTSGLSAPSVAGGVTYALGDGTLYGRSVSTGALLVQRAVPGAGHDPVVAAGHVLLGGASLRVLAP